MTYQEWAVEVATCWSRPRVGGYPPSAPLSYMAEKAFWQAVNLCGFTGSLEAWVQVVEASLGSPAPAPRKPEPKVPAPAQREIKLDITKAVGDKPEANPLDGLEEWLK